MTTPLRTWKINIILSATRTRPVIYNGLNDMGKKGVYKKALFDQFFSSTCYSRSLAIGFLTFFWSNFSKHSRFDKGTSTFVTQSIIVRIILRIIRWTNVNSVTKSLQIYNSAHYKRRTKLSTKENWQTITLISLYAFITNYVSNINIETKHSLTYAFLIRRSFWLKNIFIIFLRKRDFYSN